MPRDADDGDGMPTGVAPNLLSTASVLMLCSPGKRTMASMAELWLRGDAAELVPLKGVLPALGELSADSQLRCTLRSDALQEYIMASSDASSQPDARVTL